MEAFSQSLDAEYKEFGVRVQNQWPLVVATKMSAGMFPGLVFPSVRDWARAAVWQIGYETSMTPHWYHALQYASSRLLPRFLLTALVGRMMKKAQRERRKRR